MNKLMTVVAASVCAVSLCSSALADVDLPEKDKKETAAEALEEEESQLFEAGFDCEFFSAYVWRNAVQTDEPVIQPGVWADFTYLDPFWIGFSVWQNYDLTSRRHDALKGGLTETDYDIHVGATAWQDDEETQSLEFLLGYTWYVNQQVRSDWRESYKNTSELYLRVDYKNEIVNVYGLVAWMPDDYGDYKQGMHYELGLNKEFDVLSPFELPEDTLILGLDWNVNFGDGRYLYYLYGGVYDGETADGEEFYRNPDAGIGGTTVKAYLTWKITDWVSLVGTIAYTGVLNGSARQELGNAATGWQGDCYRRDLLWGGLSLKFAF